MLMLKFSNTTVKVANDSLNFDMNKTTGFIVSPKSAFTPFARAVAGNSQQSLQVPELLVAFPTTEQEQSGQSEYRKKLRFE